MYVFVIFTDVKSAILGAYGNPAYNFKDC